MSPHPIKAGVPKRSIALLDPLRALAAWAVVAWHLAYCVQFPMPVFASAAFAVDVFMNISGFLMLYHFVEREDREPWESPRTWSHFYIRRWFRIFPLFALLVVVCLVIPRLRADIPAAGDLWQYLLLRLTFLFGFLPGQTANAIIPDWSLALEMQFYLAFPFLALLLKRVGYGLFFFLCSLTAALATHFISYYGSEHAGALIHFPQPSLLPLKIHLFAVGMVAAGFLLKGRQVLASWWYLPGIVAYTCASLYNYTRLMEALYVILYLLLLAPTTGGGVQALFARVNAWCEHHRWLHWPADFSYSVYLLHQMLFVLVFGTVQGATGFHVSQVLPFIGLYLATLAIVNGLGFLCFVSVERPGINTGRYLLRKLSVNR